MRVGIDVDDVVVDLLTPWLAHYNVEHGTGWTPDDLTQWHFEHDLGCTREEKHKHLVDELYHNAEPHEGALEVINWIKAAGHEVVYISTCYTPSVWPEKQAWLHNHGFLGPQTRCIPVGPWAHYRTKREVGQALGIPVLVDDSVDNCRDWAGTAYLLNRPHNRSSLYEGKRLRKFEDILLELKYFPVAANPPMVLMDAKTGEYKPGNEPQWHVPGTIIEFSGPTPPLVRTFDTGATRDQDVDKLKYEGFLSPFALRRFAQYMHKHRKQSDGTLRDPDNWQKGIPIKSYQDSLIRHVMDAWCLWRSGEPIDEELLCAIIFNAQGLLHEVTKPNGKTK